jgi:hypothetical protein
MAVSSAGIYYGYKIHRGRFKKAAGWLEVLFERSFRFVVAKSNLSPL